MREIRLFGSEGGVALTTPFLPLSPRLLASGESSDFNLRSTRRWTLQRYVSLRQTCWSWFVNS